MSSSESITFRAWVFLWLLGLCLLGGKTAVRGQVAEPVSVSPLKPAINPALTTEEFAPIEARYLRFTVTKSNGSIHCIDELEVFTAESNPRNIASVEAGAAYAESGPPHKSGKTSPANLGDGLFGKRNAWYSASDSPAWVQIDFRDLERINRVVWSRDRTGKGWNETPCEYAVEVSADAENWIQVASSAARLPGLRFDPVTLPEIAPQEPGREVSELRPPVNAYFNEEKFSAIEAKYVRFTALNDPKTSVCLDELEVYSEQTGDSNLAAASAGAIASSSNVRTDRDEVFLPRGLNDGVYGEEGRWIGDAKSEVWAQIELSEPTLIDRVVWSRNRNEAWFDRMTYRYRIEVARDLGEWIEVASSDTRQSSALVHFKKSKQVLGEYIADTWEAEPGLPLNEITDFAQTPEGYLWMGTKNGLLRFDGHEFARFNRNNTPAISTPQVDAVYVDRSGRVWFTNRKFFYESGNNLVVYERGEFRRVELDKNVRVLRLFEEASGALWVLTDDEAIPMRNGELDYDGALHGFGLNDLKFLPDKNEKADEKVWGGVPGNWLHGEFVPLFGLDGRPFYDVVSSETIPQLSRRDGGAWLLRSERFGTRDLRERGFQRVLPDGNVREPRPFPWADEPIRVTARLSDRGSNLWLGVEGDGLYCLLSDGKEFRSFTGLRGFGTLDIRRIFEDAEGSIWVATSDDGLKRLRKRLFKSIGADLGIKSRFRTLLPANTYSVSPGDEGGVWIGTHSSGSYHWDDERLAYLLNSYIFSWAILQDSDGVVWTGAYGRGTRRHLKDRFQVMPRVMDHPFSFLQDSSGRVWSGGDFGVTYLEGNTLYRRVPPQFSKGRFEWVISLAEDGEGGIWMGTKLGFLHRFKDNDFETYWTSESGEEYPICALHFDEEGALWVARFGFGLSRFKDGTVSHYTQAEGIPTVSFNGILDDPSGYLWLTSKEGVYRISKQDFQRFAQGQTSPFLWQHFTERDGLPSNACNGEQNQPSLCRTEDGRIWIPTQQGVGVIDPNRLDQELAVPPVVIQSVTLYGENSREESLISDGQYSADKDLKPATITIPPGNHNLMIRYTSVEFVAPEQVSFRYRLLGADEGWIDAKNDRSALIASLRSGSYQFELTAVNHLGQAGPPASLSFRVLPYWWETPVFRFLMAGALFFGSLAWYSSRMKQLRLKSEQQADFSRQLIEREESERKRISQELHDSLGHELLLVRNRALDGANKSEGHPLQERFEDISKLAGQALENTRGMAYQLRPFELDRFGFQEAVESMVTKIAESTGKRYFKDIDELEGVLSSSALVYLYRLVQEGLNNILKHSDATVVMLEIKHEEKRVRVQLDDNGRGFSLDAARGGMGLNGMRERARLLGGQFHLNSAPGEGTRIQILIPT